jgi:hypothetical protein
MEMYGIHEIHGNPGKSMESIEIWRNLRICMEILGIYEFHADLWKSMEIHGNLWKCMKSMEVKEIHGNPYTYMEIHGNPLGPNPFRQKASQKLSICFVFCAPFLPPLPMTNVIAVKKTVSCLHSMALRSGLSVTVL